jgi:agmatine/peptidylarginine deiminase
MQELPVSYKEDGSDSSGEGIYINFLLLEDLIIMSSYKNSSDDKAAERLCDLYKRPVKKIYAPELSKEGVMINCVT